MCLDLPSGRDALPTQPGAYALVLRLAEPVRLRVGALGMWDLPAGLYVYLGSARGPGGVRARLGRHLRGGGRPRWHVDYLRAVAHPVAWGYTVAPAPGLPWECFWSQRLAAAPHAWVPVPGFGASDCRHGCPAHLVAFPPGATTQAWLRAWSEAWGLAWHALSMGD